MSRSYKKFPVYKDRARTSKDRDKPKTYANRAVRRSSRIPSGKGGFKKIYCSWIISDYRFYWCRNEKIFRALWEKGEFLWFGETYAEASNSWKKCCLRK